MEGIPKSRIEDLRDLLKGESLVKSFMESLVAECKELQDGQWQTIDEFKANPVDGWCFLVHRRFNNRTMGNYSTGRFWIDGGICKEDHITHVIPIKTPEAPK